MNRGSHSPKRQRMILSMRFNEAPIHESGKFRSLDKQWQEIVRLQ